MKNYKCNICGMVFATIQGSRIHLSLFHKFSVPVARKYMNFWFLFTNQSPSSRNEKRILRAKYYFNQ